MDRGKSSRRNELVLLFVCVYVVVDWLFVLVLAQNLNAERICFLGGIHNQVASGAIRQCCFFFLPFPPGLLCVCFFAQQLQLRIGT